MTWLDSGDPLTAACPWPVKVWLQKICRGCVDERCSEIWMVFCHEDRDTKCNTANPSHSSWALKPVADTRTVQCVVLTERFILSLPPTGLFKVTCSTQDLALVSCQFLMDTVPLSSLQLQWCFLTLCSGKGCGREKKPGAIALAQISF